MEFLGLSPSAWAIVALVVLAASFAKGLTGFAFALLSVPFLLLVLPSKEVVLLSLLMVTWNGLLITVSSWRDIRWGKWLPLTIASLPGIPLGTYILYYIDQSVLRVLIAAVVIAFALLLLLGLTRRFRREGLASLSFGFVSGILSSSTSLGGPPVVLFMVSQGWPKQAMRATLAGFLFASSLLSLGSQAIVGVLTSQTLFIGLLVAPVAICGFYLSRKIVDRIDVALFRRIAVLMVMGSGIAVLVTELV
jgi:hypothetical protein